MIILVVPRAQWTYISEKTRDVAYKPRPCLTKNWLKTERNKWADQWHTNWKHTSKNNVLFYHFKQFAYWITEHFSQNATKHQDSNTVCHLPLNHFFIPEAGWAKIITQSVVNSYSFVHLTALGCLTIFFLYNMSKFIQKKARDKFFLSFKMISIERALQCFNMCTFGSYFRLAHVCVYDLHCLFYASMCV